MLGEALSMLVPQVVGFRLRGRLREGATATDLVLTVTELLRRTGVVGKFVEYFGDGVSSLTVADRATLGNMSPEYGATCGYFPVDELTLDYLRLTGRSADHVALVEAYCRENFLWHDPDEHPVYSEVVELDLAGVEPSLAGPRRPQDRVPLANSKQAFAEALATFGVEDEGNGLEETFPASDPTTEQSPGGEPEPAHVSVARRGPAEGADGQGRDRRRGARARPRHRRDRRDHLVHEHLEPAGDGRRRTRREEGGRARASPRAVGEDVARAGIARRHRLLRALRPAGASSTSSASTRSATAARPASATPGRSSPRFRPRSPTATWSHARCSPATGTSRRASIPR